MSKSDYVTGHYAKRWVESFEDQDEQYVPEKYQLGIIADYLRSNDFEYATEKRIFSYPIDILATKDETTVAVEMKSKNVTRGVEQAHRDASLVDHAYLAVWENRVSDALLEKVENLPVGLMSVGEGVRIVSEPDNVPQQLCAKEDVIDLVTGDVRNDPAVQERE